MRRTIPAFHTPNPLRLCPLLFAAACAAPPAEPIEPAELSLGVARRGATADATSAEVDEALALADLHGLRIESLAGEGEDAFWHACAWVYSRVCFSARRQLLAARAERTSAGKPDPIGLGGETFDLTDPGLQNRVGATFDLLGVFGVGRAGAAAALAEADERAAYGALERGVWSALHEVDRARVRLAAARAREEALAALLSEVEADAVRTRILAERGWLPAGPLEAARAMSEQAARRLERERALAAERAAELSRAAGLPPEAVALANVDPTSLARFEPLEPLAPPAAETLLGSHPELRARRLEYALAEARLRRVAADAWADLRIGPGLRYGATDTLVGGLIDVSIPWPGSVKGRVAAAEERRELAREELEDALVAVLAAGESARRRLASAREVLARQGPEIELRTAGAWRAARARYSVEGAALPAWTDALERRIEGALARVDALETALVASLDYSQAIGPRAAGGPLRVAEGEAP